MGEKLVNISSWESLDELSFVDEDIRDMFRNVGGYFTGTPLVAQLIKELRLLRQELSAMRETHGS